MVLKNISINELLYVEFLGFIPEYIVGLFFETPFVFELILAAPIFYYQLQHYLLINCHYSFSLSKSSWHQQRGL